MCPRPAPWSWLKLLDVTRPLDKASLGQQQAWTARCMNGSTRERRTHEMKPFKPYGKPNSSQLCSPSRRVSLRTPH
jgi:hypothetical protein